MTTVSDYDDLIRAFKARADECGLATSLLDELTGLPDGYVGKLFGPARVKMIGLDSLWPLAEALALRITVEPDTEMARKMELRWEKRDELRRRPGVVRKRFSPEVRAKVASEWGRIGGSMRKQFRMSKKQRSAINRRNAKLGWRTRRIRAAATASESRGAGTSSAAAPASRARPARPQSASTGAPKDRAPRLLSCSQA